MHGSWALEKNPEDIKETVKLLRQIPHSQDEKISLLHKLDLFHEDSSPPPCNLLPKCLH